MKTLIQPSCIVFGQDDVEVYKNLIDFNCTISVTILSYPLKSGGEEIEL